MAVGVGCGFFRKHDSDHYLSTLLLPDSARAAVFAIRALNVECAIIPERARDPRLAQMRMAWWRNAVIDACKQPDPSAPAAPTPLVPPAPPKQPIVQVLALAARRHNLTTAYLERLIDARESLVTNSGNDQFASLPALGSYAEHTVSSILYLTLECLGFRYNSEAQPPAPVAGAQSIDASTAAVHAASHVGKAIGITTLIRGLPYNFASSGQILIPKTITGKVSPSPFHAAPSARCDSLLI